MRIPASTYRLQFFAGFGFNDAARVVDYLAALGISDVYASPIFKARPGSTHGYDVVDPNAVNPELGTEADFEKLLERSRAAGLGWLQDIVPNHLAFHQDNRILVDVLENGPISQYANFFDVDWDHPYESLRGRILAPFLGRLYGECLEDGEIKLEYGQDGFWIHYYGLRYPTKIDSYGRLLTPNLQGQSRRLGKNHLSYIKFLGVLYVLKSLGGEQELDPGDHYDQIRFIKEMLWELYNDTPEIRDHLDRNVAGFNGDTDRPDKYARLDELLNEQYYRLSFWKVATEELNYRRFFTINDLISVRQEDPLVFDHSHGLVRRLVAAGAFTGLRVDHIDGLYDPQGYLDHLRMLAGDAYVVVEKILEAREELPASWPVQGTTGYDFLNHVNGVFCDQRNEKKFARLYSRFIGEHQDPAALANEKKRLIVGKEMAGDVDNLAHQLKNLMGQHRHGRDLTLYGIRRAIVEVLTHFPVYRTYMNSDQPGEDDRRRIGEAVARALIQQPGLAYEIEFIKSFLLMKLDGRPDSGEEERWLEFVMRFQQFTSPLMAKGFEDTYLYIFNRLLSLNEVGGAPRLFGFSLGEFHANMARRCRTWPHAMNASATHDTKRGEDFRARLNVLSEIPDEWNDRLRRWKRMNAGFKRKLGELNAPDANDEYFLYQTLVGALPFEAEREGFEDRLVEYLIKAVREAKVHTAWIRPDADYEDAYIGFARRLLAPESDFFKDFEPFQKKIAHHGIFNSLAQTLIKVAAPGMPDFYQGTELWDLSMVDPDNRRPVDYEFRRKMLDGILARADSPDPMPPDLFENPADGRVKMYLVQRLLKARNRYADLFRDGDYAPLGVMGKFSRHVIAFARVRDRETALAVAPRFTTGLGAEGGIPAGAQVWQDTRMVLPAALSGFEWTNALTGDVVSGPEPNTLEIGEILKKFPAALLIHGES